MSLRFTQITFHFTVTIALNTKLGHIKEKHCTLHTLSTGREQLLHAGAIPCHQTKLLNIVLVCTSSGGRTL